MSKNLLEQLGQQPVPAPPSQLRREVHDRVNTQLVVVHVADLMLQALPETLLHFGQAVGGLLTFTLTGTYEPRVRDDARNDGKR